MSSDSPFGESRTKFSPMRAAIESLRPSPVSRDSLLAIATPVSEGLVLSKRSAIPMGYSRYAISF